MRYTTYQRTTCFNVLLSVFKQKIKRPIFFKKKEKLKNYWIPSIVLSKTRLPMQKMRSWYNLHKCKPLMFDLKHSFLIFFSPKGERPKLFFSKADKNEADCVLRITRPPIQKMRCNLHAKPRWSFEAFFINPFKEWSLSYKTH